MPTLETPPVGIFGPKHDEESFGLLMLKFLPLHARSLDRKASGNMAVDKEQPVSFVPANDNQGRDEADRQTEEQVERVVLMIARLIGRRIAREQFAALSAPNDNEPQVVQDDGDNE